MIIVIMSLGADILYEYLSMLCVFVKSRESYGSLCYANIYRYVILCYMYILMMIVILCHLGLILYYMKIPPCSLCL